tara:strand:+ start:77 stop:832 length:756 start_codon:yes stop_codon:yes gene_type:complete
MKKPIIAGNWKMNLPWPKAKPLICDLLGKLTGKIYADIILFPDFTILKAVNDLLNGSAIKIGGQNMYCKDKGAYTGEVSADMLLDCGCSYVLLGHSERRKFFRETDRHINEKLHLAFDKKLSPVLCVGETLEERETNRTADVLRNQISLCFKDVKRENLKQIVIAYEPVWAIGTGKHATPEQAYESHRIIRSIIRDLYNSDVGEQMDIIYGGSVNPKNSSRLLALEEVDGVLIGNSSLIADSFYAIISSVT